MTLLPLTIFTPTFIVDVQSLLLPTNTSLKYNEQKLSKLKYNIPDKATELVNSFLNCKY